MICRWQTIKENQMKKLFIFLIVLIPNFSGAQGWQWKNPLPQENK